MELALLRAGFRADLRRSMLLQRDPIARKHAFETASKMMATVHHHGDRYLFAVKGAPEAVLAASSKVLTEHGEAVLDSEMRSEWHAHVEHLAHHGLRVLACATKTGMRSDTPPYEDLTFVGLIGLEDPARADVPHAIKHCSEAGIRVVMVTGDHAATARSIARAVGLGHTIANVVEGKHVERFTGGNGAGLSDVSIFARVSPAEKLALVRAYQATGAVVAMTGDGVNDAPALRQADIGVAMGLRGTDVAREAAEVVLLDERVGSIVDGIALGRRVFDNLRRVMVYIVAIHVPIAGAALLPLLMGLPPLLLPVHVVLTEMVIDPMCSLVFEGAPARADLMRRPPSAAGRALVDLRVMAKGLLQGASMLVAVLATYGLALRLGLATDSARALAILGLTAGNVALVVVNAGADLGRRSLVRADFASFWIVAALAAMAIAVGMWLPAAQALLHFEQPPAIGSLAVLVVIGTIALGLARLPSRRP
jgi:Ca2+-transporting ATPase